MLMQSSAVGAGTAAGINQVCLKAAFAAFGGEQFLRNQSPGPTYLVFSTPKGCGLFEVEDTGEIC